MLGSGDAAVYKRLCTTLGGRLLASHNTGLMFAIPVAAIPKFAGCSFVN